MRSTLQYLRDHQLEAILAAGILLRLVVFAFQGPYNLDPHVEVIRHIYWSHTLPPVEKYHQSFQPPLYYVLGTFFLRSGTDKPLQFFSCLLSCGALTFIYLLIKRLAFIQPLWIKQCCLLLAALLPQFILFGNFVSNDPLSYFIGAAMFLLMFRYIQKATLRNQNMLAIAMGLGLLTKGTMLPFYPVLVLLIAIVNLRTGAAWRTMLARVSIFLLISLAIGSYPYARNIIHQGRPFVHNLDFDPSWAKGQRPTYLGLQTIFDVNIFKLMQHPVVSDHTKHSYPLMLYGTFWYQYIPESTFKGSGTSLKYLGSLIYLVALVPTLLFGIGFYRILASVPHFLKKPFVNNAASQQLLFETASVLAGILCLALVIIAGVKYDVWSCFQSRLLFPALASFLVAFANGLWYVQQRHAAFAVAASRSLYFLFFLFAAYFASEIALMLMR